MNDQIKASLAASGLTETGEFVDLVSAAFYGFRDAKTDGRINLSEEVRLSLKLLPLAFAGLRGLGRMGAELKQITPAGEESIGDVLWQYAGARPPHERSITSAVIGVLRELVNLENEIANPPKAQILPEDAA